MEETSEEFAKRMDLQFGLGWRSDLGLLNKYNRLKQLEESEEVIKQSTKVIEESFKGKRKDLAFAKLIKGLEELALESLRDRSMKQELFEKQNVLFEEKIKLVASLKRHLKQTIDSFEKTKGVLIRQLEGEIEKTKRLQTKAEETIEQHNKKIGTLNAQILEYNEKLTTLNEQYARFNNRVKKFNKRVTDLNKRRGMRA